MTAFLFSSGVPRVGPAGLPRYVGAPLKAEAGRATTAVRLQTNRYIQYSIIAIKMLLIRCPKKGMQLECVPISNPHQLASSPCTHSFYLHTLTSRLTPSLVIMPMTF